MRPRRPPRVLYLSFYFPPSRASGVYRARATANHLVARGWDVTVFAAPPRFLQEVAGSADDALLDTVDPRIRVERPRLSTFRWERDIRRFSRFRRTMPVLAARLYDAGQRIFPEHYSSWGLDAVGRALRLHARRRFDVVLATGNPFSAFAAAWLFHRLTGVPYVVDYRDSWTLDLFAERPAYPPDHPAWTWERRVLGDAAAAVFVNEALRGWHAERYPDVADRMLVVPNGWDPDLLTEADPVPTTPALRFSYVGTVTAAQPVETMVEAFRIARGHPELADAELHIHGHLGFSRGAEGILRRRLGLDADPSAPAVDPGLRYRGPVAKTDVSRAYAESDVLVFLAGGARYVTSGKIFEYMATGRPIVSVHAPGIAAAEVLRGYPLWCNPDSLDPERIARSMMAAGKLARARDPELRAAARRHAEAYTRHTVLEPLEATLRTLVGRRRSTRGAGAPR
nr:glycosyltransferase [Micromonospora sp. HM5-17]